MWRYFPIKIFKKNLLITNSRVITVLTYDSKCFSMKQMDGLQINFRLLWEKNLLHLSFWSHLVIDWSSREFEMYEALFVLSFWNSKFLVSPFKHTFSEQLGEVKVFMLEVSHISIFVRQCVIMTQQDNPSYTHIHCHYVIPRFSAKSIVLLNLF